MDEILVAVFLNIVFVAILALLPSKKDDVYTKWKEKELEKERQEREAQVRQQQQRKVVTIRAAEAR